MFDPVTVAEAHQRALQTERQLARRVNPTPAINANSSMPPSRPEPHSTMPQQSRPMSQQPRPTGGIRCFNCGELGQRQADCRITAKTNLRGLLANDLDVDSPPIFDTEAEPVDGDTEHEFVEGDVGPLLMLRRTFLNSNVTDEDWRHTALFSSSCTIAGKVCQLIIDSCSCENVPSELAVQKLGLTLEKHPKPYKLAWYPIEYCSPSLLALHTPTRYSVTWFLWMLATFFWVVHGNLTARLCMMVMITPTPFFFGEKRLCYYPIRLALVGQYHFTV